MSSSASDEDSPADPDCHVPYRATFLRTVKRPSNSGPETGTVGIWLTERASLEPGREYVIWLTWRPDKNALDSGYHTDGLVREVVDGRVTLGSGPCVDIGNPPLDYCRHTYSVDELLTMYEAALTATARTLQGGGPQR